MMKKTLFACTVALILLFASSAFAMDYVLGARAGFFFWSPYYKDMPENSGFDEIRTGHGGLYGPIFVANFTNEFAFSISGLFGQQTTQWHSWGDVVDYGTEVHYTSGTSYLKSNRYDVDSAVSYLINEGLRLFIGYKFQYMDVQWIAMERRYEDKASDEFHVDEQEFNFKVPIHGIALGIGYSNSLSDLYFFSVSVSGIYTRGLFKYTQDRTKYGGTSPDPLPSEDDSGEFDVQQYGVNIEPSFGIRTSGPIVTLGVRYQLLRTQFYELESSGQGGPDGRWMNDQLYGVFVAVMFVM